MKRSNEFPRTDTFSDPTTNHAWQLSRRLVALAVLGLAVASGVGATGQVLDQQHDPSGTVPSQSVIRTVGANERHAQTLRSGVAGQLAEVELYLSKIPPGIGTIEVPLPFEIRRTLPSGVPSDALSDRLASLTIPPAAIGTVAAFVRIDVRSFGIQVGQGEGIAIVLGGEINGRGQWGGSQGNPYAAGVDQVSTRTFISFPFSSWTPAPGDSDLGFRTYVIPAPRPPAILSHPVSQLVKAGRTVTFSVVASGDPPLRYQWRKDGVDQRGAIGDTLTLASIQSSDGGDYTVVVENNAGTIVSLAATLTVPPIKSTAIRSLPSTFTPGVPLPLSVQVNPEAGVLSYKVEEWVPPGWRADGIDNGGVFDAVGHVVRWDRLLGATPRTLRYETTPPVGATGTIRVTGSASFDGATILVTGGDASTASAIVPPSILTGPRSQTVPAGTTVQFCVTAAGTPPPTFQWRKSQTPIPGATRSCLTLTNVQPVDAGDYSVRIESSAGQIASSNAALVVKAVRSSGTRTLSPNFQPATPFAVSIATVPERGVFAYAVEDQVPGGWTVGPIDNGGTFDARNGKVKWGPYMDDMPRTLGFTVTPPATAKGSATFAGKASFDGLSVPLGGGQVTTSGSAVLRISRAAAGDAIIEYSGGLLVVADVVTGPYSIVVGALSPYRVSAGRTMRFYAVR